MTSDASIATVREAFSDVARPSGLFVRGTCLCCECISHNEVLAAHDPDSITLKELGNPGYDPMCFASDEAFAYYMPAMVRLAFEDHHYMEQIVFHLTMPGRVERLSPAHAKAVRAALWSWSAIYLEKVSTDWNITGEIYRFEEALRRLEAAANSTAYQP